MTHSLQDADLPDPLLIAEYTIGLHGDREARDAERLLRTSEAARIEYSLWIERLNRLMPPGPVAAPVPNVLPQVMTRLFGVPAAPVRRPRWWLAGVLALVILAAAKVAVLNLVLDLF